MKLSFIVVRTDFSGFHHYPNAGNIDNRIAFLENTHHHTFGVKVKMNVTHNDREQEFFLVKWQLDGFIEERVSCHKNNYKNEVHSQSCEMIADCILNEFLIPRFGQRIYEVSVSEDGIFDGVVSYIPD